ncbi:hypothetical protein EC957_009479 [Mortierella hygrophila]|uniref:Uncharacterized protein n=1 Tax=Mortierella hygrophila TaxID=979708 RepID=A0A9P6FC86_9FUNG|nr:hypothetical protein EC957_009479 [Mortierella hygrophila]
MFMRVRTDLEMTSELNKDTLIINTISPAAQGFTISPMIKAESLVPSLSSRLPRIEALVAELLTVLCPDLDNDLQAEVTLVGQNLRVYQHTGCVEELASAAAKDSRVMVEDEFGLTNKYNSDRKVDLSVRVYADHTWQNEIAVYEFKSSSGSDAISRQQQHKFVWLNGVILLDLEQRGVDISKCYPIIAEGRGLVLDFYTLRRYDDVLGAGRFVSTLVTIALSAAQAVLEIGLHSYITGICSGGEQMQTLRTLASTVAAEHSDSPRSADGCRGSLRNLVQTSCDFDTLLQKALGLDYASPESPAANTLTAPPTTSQHRMARPKRLSHWYPARSWVTRRRSKKSSAIRHSSARPSRATSHQPARSTGMQSRHWDRTFQAQEVKDRG